MLRDGSSGRSTGRGYVVGGHLNSPVCVMVSDVYRFVPVATLCVRTRRGSIVRANRTSRDYQLVRIVLKRRRRVQVGAAVGWAIKRVLRLGRDRGPLSVGQLRANVVTKVPHPWLA
jgi:hypothetical protein